VGLNAQVALAKSDEHRKMHHPVRHEVMKLQPEVAEEPPHERVRRDLEPGNVEGDEGDDL
jgi:hypothetical protein